jgi:hypothetical protein
MSTDLLSQPTVVTVETPAEISRPDAPAAQVPERISERGWFLRGVMAASLLLIAGFWAGVGVAVMALLP